MTNPLLIHSNTCRALHTPLVFPDLSCYNLHTEFFSQINFSGNGRFQNIFFRTLSYDLSRTDDNGSVSDFQGCGSFHAHGRPDKGIRTGSRILADPSLHSNRTQHHGSQPLRHQAEEPEKIPGILVNLPGGLHHAGRHKRDALRNDIADILRSGLYGG